MFKAGMLIGEYRLIRQIGRDGFSESWIAEKLTSFKNFTKNFTLEIFYTESIPNQHFLENIKFWFEVNRHPYIHTIVDAQIHEDIPFTATEYIEDQTLQTLLELKHQLSIEFTVSLMSEILEGLEYLHSQGIIHRDLKPKNIFIFKDKPIISGLYLASKVTKSDYIIAGTVRYMSPEAFDGKFSFQSDIWSIGVILYQILSGELPFKGNSISSFPSAIMFQQPEPLSSNIPKSLQKIVSQCLEKDSTKRFKTVAEVREKLNGLSLLANESNERKNLIFASFNFPEEMYLSCEQYLLYFAQFLQDLGINVNSDLKEEAGKVLFSVIPTDDIEALEKIREALAVYLKLPGSPISEIEYSENFALMRLQQQVRNLQHSQQMAKTELLSAQYALRLAQQNIDNQDQFITRQNSFIENQNKIIEKITDRAIMINSAENKEELEEIYEGVKVGESKWLKELTGIGLNPAKAIKTAVKNTFGKDEKKSILGLNED